MKKKTQRQGEDGRGKPGCVVGCFVDIQERLVVHSPLWGLERAVS